MSSLNLGELRRNRMGIQVGGQSVEQIEHLGAAGAKLVTVGVLAQGNVITADPSAAPVLVRAGSILRIQVTADTYIAFGNPDDGSFAAPASATTSPGLKLVGATGPTGVYIVVASDDFLISSAALTRLEVIQTNDAGAGV